MSNWRGIMGSVAEKCGDAVAAALMEELAGSVVYVPKKFMENGPLKAIGQEKAEALIAEFAAETLYIPSRLAARADYRDMFEKVEKLVDEGLTTSEIAGRLGISQGYVFQVRRRAGAPKIAKKPDPRQISLFD